MTARSTSKWVALALVGLLVAIAVAFAGSRLVSRQIGLSSEPIGAGDQLAPRVVRTRTPPAPAPETGESADAEGPAAAPPSESGSEEVGDSDRDADD
jgi:hypothetical protein